MVQAEFPAVSRLTHNETDVCHTLKGRRAGTKGMSVLTEVNMLPQNMQLMLHPPQVPTC